MPKTHSGPARGTTPGRARKNSHHQVAAASAAHGSRDREERASLLLRVPVAFAVGYAPAGRRRLWLSVVATCPVCSRPHAHRGTEAGVPHGVVRAGCGRASYWLVVE